MTNDTHAKICNRCLNHISTFGLPCLNLLKLICKQFNESSSLIYFEDYGYNQTIKYLEQKGYVITTECGRVAFVAFPNIRDKQAYNEDRIYCWCKRGN